MTKIILLRDLPWLDLSPTEEMLREVELNISEQWGDFYAIYGPAASGKTRFLIELGKRLTEYENILVGALDANQTTLLEKFAELLGGDPQSTVDMEMLAQLIEPFVEEHRQIVILIDEAEKLSTEQLSLFYQLKERFNSESYFHITLVLFMDLNNQDIFSRELLKKAVGFTLGPVNIAQIRRLVDHAYKFFEREHDFTSSDLKKLHSLSYGYPGRLLRILDLRPKFKPTFKHLFFLLLILAFLIGGSLAYYINDRAYDKRIETTPEIAEFESDRIKVAREVHLHSALQKGLPRLLELGRERARVKQAIIIQQVQDDFKETIQQDAKDIGPIKELEGVTPLEVDSQSSALLSPTKGSSEPKNKALSHENTINTGGESNRDDKASIETKGAEIKPEVLQKKKMAKEVPTTVSQHYIRLSTGDSRESALAKLRGRSVPGAPKVKRVGNQWITYIGPYGSKAQAEKGLKQLPSSLRALPLQVISASAIGE